MSKTPSVLDNHPLYQATIGIEVHVQLTTKSKIFCSCANQVIKQPNQNICPICAGHPGVLPVLNKQVVDYAILTGLATNCAISPVCQFARKHYFYPDLPKGFQITQSEPPICTNGYIPIRLEDGSIKKIRLMRIHMEEDSGKSIHTGGSNESFVDLNRAGTPLLEIVSQPDIASAYEARAYLKTLHAIVQYLQVCSGNMEEGAFRADTNISVKKRDTDKLGTRIELKNINSFKFIGDAIEYELERQVGILEQGGTVSQETCLWDSKEKKTVAMRSKSEAADYRYFTEPDIPPLAIDADWIERIKKTMPELPYERFDRFITQLGLTPYEAEILIDDMPLADYFEAANKLSTSKLVINWILRDLMGHIKEQKISLAECKVTPEKLVAIVTLLEQNKINNLAAKEVFGIVAQTGQNPVEIVKERGLEQVGTVAELETIVKEIITVNPEQVTAYKSGKDKLFGFFVGQAMQKTAGKADPKMISELVKKHLS
ncbi:Asp-tRNA(Asn)/Glu-tRNA(Gln) amidotransferase GatCAB subunit B [Candidatus Dependentiae bacterium HGW-Dependentiae-1]|nr:MAG: Asp-tRNA(Asn)/Glu-tRNA(Gln) amidotransferase GatCAB subunit B [Candidatus Dependentiae bacterium HGW-Dependentiae-1]